MARWVVLLLLAPGLLILIAVVVAFILHRPRRPTDPMPGYYHVLGVDAMTGARRESTFYAQSRESALGRAAMEGIVVMDVQRVERTPSDIPAED